MIDYIYYLQNLKINYSYLLTLTFMKLNDICIYKIRRKNFLKILNKLKTSQNILEMLKSTNKLHFKNIHLKF